MSGNSIALGLLLILAGLFFFLREMNLPYAEQLFTWQTILVLIGLFLALGAGKRKNAGQILPGIILIGLGTHFWGLERFPWWPRHWAVYPFIVSVAFFAHYLKAKESGILLSAFLLLAVSLFSTVLNGFLKSAEWAFGLIEEWWPAALIVLGVIIVFRSLRK